MKKWQKEIQALCEERVNGRGYLAIRKYQDKYGKTEVNVFIVKWFIEKYLKWDEKKIKECLCIEVFYSAGFESFLRLQYNQNVYKALEEAYPNKYRPWELKRAPRNYWNKEKAIEAFEIWLKEVVKWSDEEICTKFNRHRIQDTKPFGTKFYWLLRKFLGDDEFIALNTIYPGKFKQENGKIVLNQ